MTDLPITVTVTPAAGGEALERYATSLDAFVAANADALDGDEIAAMSRMIEGGEEYVLGGGAAPIVILAPAC